MFEGKKPVGMVTERDFAKYTKAKVANIEWKEGRIERFEACHFGGARCKSLERPGPDGQEED